MNTNQVLLPLRAKLANQTIVQGNHIECWAITDARGTEVARTTNLFPAEESQAYARIFAASPKLLKALKRIDGMGAGGRAAYKKFAECVSIAHQAINEAEGTP